MLIGCLVPIPAAVLMLVGAGVMVGTRLQAATPHSVAVRVIDDGAQGGPQVLSTAVVPLR